MEPAENGNHIGEIQEEFSFRYHDGPVPAVSHEHRREIEERGADGSSNNKTLQDFIPIYIPTIQKGLIRKSRRQQRFFDFLKARPTNDWFLRFGFLTRSLRSRNPMSDNTDTRAGRRFRVPFVRKINWRFFIDYFKKWIRSPFNLALFIWVILCAIGLIWLVLLMIGAFNGVIKSSDRRKDWEEIINQVLNALFTMMCVYQHPTIFHHLVLVVRWRPDDQVAARSIYSKNGFKRPNDRAHMSFVVFLLHFTCLCQYAYCALFWGWSRHNRPDWPQYLLLGLGVGSPLLAAWYTFYGPLGKNNVNEESQTQTNRNRQPTEPELALYHRRVVVTSPEWIGGLFDCWDDMTVAWLSCFCTFCVFGWNAERLGFGNMYVHIFTFVFLCLSPLWIFAITALNIDDDTIKIIVVASGAICCVLGLLYGGYWRSKIRRKFRLPENTLVCGDALMTDFAKWLFCCACALAQEVRTANFYDIEDDGFYRRVTDEEGRAVLVPLPREGNLTSPRSLSSPPKLEGISAESLRETQGGCGPIELSVIGRASTYSKVHAMKAPLPPSMQHENEDARK